MFLDMEQQCKTALTLLTSEMREFITPLEAHRIKAFLMKSFGTEAELSEEDAEKYLSMLDSIRQAYDAQKNPQMPQLEIVETGKGVK